MSVSMRFRGTLCFRSIEARDRALDVFGKASSCLVRPDAVAISHLMIGIDIDAVARNSLWRETLSVLTDAASMASSGAVSCTIDGQHSEHVVVVASGRIPARPSLPLRSAAQRWAAASIDLPDASPAARFAFEACHVFTCYALPAEDAEPSEQTPSFVFGAVPRRGIAPLVSDVAPYLTVSPMDAWEASLNRAVANAQDDDALREGLQEMLAWSQETGATWFGHQLEPAALAGQGTARKLGREVALRDPPAESWEDGNDEFPLACESPWVIGEHGRHVCPSCGSEDTVVVSVEDRRAGVIEVRCRTCEHFDAWTT